ncbi:MAG: helix-turn-helix domain-containing protein [Enterocloster clostridioformis]
MPLDKIANELNYSKFYIARIFTEETKCTIYKYIQGRRLTLAAQKLVETELSIVEIAYEAHYDSHRFLHYV